MDIEKSIRENQLGAKLHVGKVLGGVDTIEKSVVEDIQKSKPAVAGEIREWSGKKYKKQANGKWLEVSEHGMTKKEHDDNSKKHEKMSEREWNRSEKQYRSEDVKRAETQAMKHAKEAENHDQIASKLSDKEFDEEDIQKGSKFPIGTIHNGYKKVGEGDWRKVSSHGMTKKEHTDALNKVANDSKSKKSLMDRELEAQKHFKEKNKLDDKQYSDEDVMGGKEDTHKDAMKWWSSLSMNEQESFRKEHPFFGKMDKDYAQSHKTSIDQIYKYSVLGRK